MLLVYYRACLYYIKNPKVIILFDKKMHQRGTIYSFKSQTLNPEQKQYQLPQFEFEETDVDINGDLNAEDQFIATTASRAKRKLQSTTQSNMRKLSFCGSQRKQVKRGRSCSREMLQHIYFNQSETISHMVRQRHTYQYKTLTLSNFHSYLSNQLTQKTKKKQAIQKTQIRLAQKINENKSQKSFFSKSIQQNKAKLYETKIKSKSIVLRHKQNMKQILDNLKKEKQQAGVVGREETMLNDSVIKEERKKQEQGKKLAVERGRSYEEKLHQQKLEREEMKKRLAEENYRRKWTHQMMLKQKAERQNLRRTKKLSKKIQILLSEISKTSSRIEYLNNKKQ